MANKMVLKKKNLNSRQEVVTSHPVMCALIYSFIFPKSSNCITEFSELTRTPSRKYIYFWKAMISTADIVVLLYDERIFIDILKNQPPNIRNVNSYRKVLQTCSKAVRPCR